jgi:sugar-specific transcriptional regulator TrmB
MLDSILLRLGLTSKEASIYLHCLELGPQPVSVIAKRTGLKRTTAYANLENLGRKGLISQHVEKSVKYFSATNPNNLHKILQAKKDDCVESEELLINSMSDFLNLIHPQRANPNVRFYEGIHGIEQVMDDTLSAKKGLLCYTTMDFWFALPELKRYISSYCSKRVKRKVPLKSIMADTPIGRKYLADYPKKTLWESRWLPKKIAPFTNEINIYDDKIAICCLEKNELLGIIVESKGIANTQRSIFELAWMSARPDIKLYD